MDELILELQEENDPLSIELQMPVPISPTKDYEALENKPRINGVELIGNKTSRELHIQETDALSNVEIEQIIQSVF